jgi:hypothetical protein
MPRHPREMQLHPARDSVTLDFYSASAPVSRLGLPRAEAAAGQLRARRVDHAARQSGFSRLRRFPTRGVGPGRPRARGSVPRLLSSRCRPRTLLLRSRLRRADLTLCSLARSLAAQLGVALRRQFTDSKARLQVRMLPRCWAVTSRQDQGVVDGACEVPTTAIRSGLFPPAVGATVGGIKRDGLRSPHSSGGAFGERSVCFRRVAARNCSPYCRTIAAAGFSRIPTPPRSSTKAHSAAIRLTTFSAVKIGGISLPWQTCAGFSSQAPVLSLYRSRASSLHSAHSMRAAFITTALENGAQLEDVQKAAGHRDPGHATTRGGPRDLARAEREALQPRHPYDEGLLVAIFSRWQTHAAFLDIRPPQPGREQPAVILFGSRGQATLDELIEHRSGDWSVNFFRQGNRRSPPTATDAGGREVPPGRRLLWLLPGARELYQRGSA